MEQHQGVQDTPTCVLTHSHSVPVQHSALIPALLLCNYTVALTHTFLKHIDCLLQAQRSSSACQPPSHTLYDTCMSHT